MDYPKGILALITNANGMFDIEAAKAILNKYYAINAELEYMPGDVDYNFKVSESIGTCYVLKISRIGVLKEDWAIEAEMIAHLKKNNCPLDLPGIILSIKGDEIVELEDGRLARVLTWVDGSLLADINPRTPELRASWGNTMGHLSKAMQGYEQPLLHKPMRWDPSETLKSRDRIKYFSEEEAELANYFWKLFEKEALPVLQTLRKSVNYSDGHEMNLLCNSKALNRLITGVIDFGDATYSNTVCELAIALAYGSMDTADPLQAAREIIAGYHAVFPLEEKELAVLFHLVIGRLLITVANAAWGRHEEPDNTYLSVSEQQAWSLLRKFRKMHPHFVHYTFRAACGLEPCPLNASFKQWLEQERPEFHEVLDVSEQKIVPLDLGVGSLELGNFKNYSDKETFAKTVNRILSDKAADIGYGGYGEIRPIYTTDAYKVATENGPQWRTVHLGFDIWTAAGVGIRSPYRGRVHSLGYNNADRDYGGCVILEHTNAFLTFYTLYGHLSKGTIEQLTVGQEIAGGEVFAYLGTANENGHWPPHLHMQLILDIMSERGDYPGVAFPHMKDVYLSLCPDPTLLSDKFTSPVLTDTNPQELLGKRKQMLGKSLSVSYQRPLHIVRGQLQYLMDATGRRYVDTCNNVAHVGHEHPKVVEAILSQAALLNTNTRYLHDNILMFAEDLLATLPKTLSVVHFVNSGSEANELALRMARSHRNRKDMIAVEVGYHGSTGACVDVSSYKFDGKGGQGAPELTQVVPIPDSYRGLHRGLGMGVHYAAYIGEAIERIEQKGRALAGFICESILSCGGQVVLPEGYLASAFAQVRAAGGVCIMDEVQVGLGRVGSHFWGFELQGVVPDIVTIGKPIGNGFPLGVVVTTREIADSFSNGMEFFSTFGGNPVACAVGSTVFSVLKEEGLQAQALELGSYMKERLSDMGERYPIIGNVRGHGLFLGMELVGDRDTLEPAVGEASYLINRMRELGFLMSSDGPYNNVIKIKPPMCFSQANADELMYYLDQVLGEDGCRL